MNAFAHAAPAAYAPAGSPVPFASQPSHAIGLVPAAGKLPANAALLHLIDVLEEATDGHQVNACLAAWVARNLSDCSASLQFPSTPFSGAAGPRVTEGTPDNAAVTVNGRRLHGPSVRLRFGPESRGDEARRSLAFVASRVALQRVAELDLGCSPNMAPLPASLDDLERRAIQAALRASSGNRTRAAALLGINRTTLYKKLLRETPNATVAGLLPA